MAYLTKVKLRTGRHFDKDDEVSQKNVLRSWNDAVYSKNLKVGNWRQQILFFLTPNIATYASQFSAAWGILLHDERQHMVSHREGR